METHGHFKGYHATPEYITWGAMLGRCRNPKHQSYSQYGARGITVCKRWYLFTNFFEDMGFRPKSKSLDRIDNSKGYSPENCRWASRIEQSNNRRGNKRITAFGKNLTLSEWAREIGISKVTLRSRIVRGWSTERALSNKT